MKKLAFVFALLPACLIMASGAFNLDLSVDPANMEDGSELTFRYDHNFASFRDIYVLTPQLNARFNGDFDASLCFTKRFEVGDGEVGAGVFWVDSRQSRRNFLQMGVGVDYVMDRAEFRANYYNPVGQNYTSYYYTIQAHDWVEVSALFKTRYVNVEVSPNYDITTEAYGANIGLNFPTTRFSVNFALDNLKGPLETEFGLCVSYSIFNSDPDVVYRKGLTHRPKVRYSFVESISDFVLDL